MKLVSRDGEIACLDKILHGRCFRVKGIIKDPLLRSLQRAELQELELALVFTSTIINHD